MIRADGNRGVVSGPPPSGGGGGGGSPSGAAGGGLSGTYPNPNVATSHITLARMADIATDRLIGRDTASTGIPEALTVGGGIEFTGSGGIQRSALSGDVSASAGSGTVTVNKVNGVTPSANTLAMLDNTFAEWRSDLGLVIGTDVQAQDATLAALAGAITAADKVIYATGVDTFTTTDLTSTARSLLDDTSTSAMRTTLGLAIGTNVQAYDDDLAAIANLTSAANKLPYFTGSGTADVADFTAAARSLLDDADASAMRTTLGLVIGTNVQAYDAELAAIAGLTSAADVLPYFTGSGTASTTTFTSTARSLLDDSSTSAMRTTLGLVIGTDVQAQDAELAAIAGLTSAADKLPYFTGSGTAALTDITSTARSLLDDSSASAMRTTLGLTDASVAPQFVILPSDVSNSTTTMALATGWKFTPTASKTYLIQVWGAYTSASTATGLTWCIADHLTAFDGNAAVYQITRGSASTVVSSVIGSAATGNDPNALGNPASAALSSGIGMTPIFGMAIWTADASPNDVGIYFASEVGSSAVTLKGGRCALSYLQLD